MKNLKKSINQNALLVTCKISQWNGKKTDRAVTSEVAHSHNATREAGRYVKNLIDPNVMKSIVSQANIIRKFIYTNTLAWGENSERVLSAQMYFEFMAKFSELKEEFDGMVKDLLDIYEEEIDRARSMLGTMFRESDYPTRGEIEGKFDINLTVLPIPEENVNINLPDEVKEGIEEQIKSEISKRSLDANLEIRDRLKEALIHLRDKMNAEGGRIHDSSFDNLIELANLIPKMNIWGDDKIDELSDKILNSITERPEDVRNSEANKKKVSDKAQDLIDNLKYYF